MSYDRVERLKMISDSRTIESFHYRTLEINRMKKNIKQHSVNRSLAETACKSRERMGFVNLDKVLCK